MNLKQRFSFIFSSLFSVLLATVMLTVYYLFADFRKDEFSARLAEKAQTTAKLLIEVKEIDYNMQKLIDKNSINKLYNENTQVYDSDKKLIYSSSDTPNIHWTNADLDRIKKNHRVYKKTSQDVVLGLYDVIDGKGYYVLISAEDTYDNNKLAYLKYLLLGAFLFGTVTVWILSFSLSKKALQPLDNFRKKIQEITDSNLKIRLSEAKKQDEINLLAKTFNQMMDRIDDAYNRQKEFTGNASHELRTPVARIAAQLENLLQKADVNGPIKSSLTSIFEDTFQLSEIISSLIALSNINNRGHSLSFEKTRLDEMVFSGAAELSKIYPDFKLKFEIENVSERETDLEIYGDDTLLKIIVLNLLKNACIYSDNRLAECLIIQKQDSIDLIITNTGEVPSVEDTGVLFNTFYRGSNTKQVPGSGIGLSIVSRGLQYLRATITYRIINNNTNRVIVTFPHSMS